MQVRRVAFWPRCPRGDGVDLNFLDLSTGQELQSEGDKCGIFHRMTLPRPTFANMRSACLQAALLAAWSLSISAQAGDRLGHGDRFPPPIDPRCIQLQAGDEIWITSSRQLSTCGPVDLDRVETCRWNGEGWISAETSELKAVHRTGSATTVMFLHGNRTNLEWSAHRGLQVFQGVFGNRPDRPPVRFVIWSWPADPSHCRVKEYRDNSFRSVWEANVLSGFIRELGTEHPIGLLGYSFGAQAVVLAAEQSCASSVETADSPFDLRIACIAPAYQKPWSRVGESFSGAADCATQALQIINSSDRALRAHYAINRIFGKSYACLTQVDEIAAKGCQSGIDVGELVGSEHSIVRYASHPLVAEAIRATMFAAPGRQFNLAKQAASGRIQFAE